MLTSCPACLQGLSRYSDDNNMPADYIVIEMAKHILGENWLDEFVKSQQRRRRESVAITTDTEMPSERRKPSDGIV